MEGTAKDIPVIDWLEFPSATDKEVQWNIHMPFMLSHWNCIFGRGCPGVIFKDDSTHQPGKGCCFDGAYINTETEFKRIEGYVAQLTEEDLDAENLAVIKEKGYAYHFTQPGQEDPDDPDIINAKTRVYKGRCILSRSDGGGCSLLHLAGRQTGKGANNVPHTLTMPDVCWQLPIKREHVWNEELEREVITLYPWDADAWETDQMEWWCVNDSAAYTSKEPLYITMEQELRVLMGNTDYETLAVECERRYVKRTVRQMPAELPDGVTLIPLAIKGRTQTAP